VRGAGAPHHIESALADGRTSTGGEPWTS
jgi:hypothetical protein